MISTPVLPAVYKQRSCQSKGKKRQASDSSEEENEIEQGAYQANDIWKKKRQLLMPVKKNKAGFYQKPALSLRNLEAEKIIKLSDFKETPTPVTAKTLIQLGLHLN